MPKLDFMILCDHVHMDRGKLYMLGAGIDTIASQSFPSAHDVGIALRMLVTPAECGRTHPVEVIFQTEDGQRLLEINGEFSAELPPNHPPGARIGVGLAIGGKLPLPAAGTYSLVLMVRDSEEKAITVRAVQAPGPEPAAG